MFDLSLELSLRLLLLTVRFLRSMKSLGLSNIRPVATSGRLGRTLLGLGSSESSEVSKECGGKSRFRVSTCESPLDSSEVTLLVLLSLQLLAGVVLGPISTNLTLQVLVVLVAMVVGLSTCELFSEFKVLDCGCGANDCGEPISACFFSIGIPKESK